MARWKLNEQMQPEQEQIFWNAVESHDASMDGAFVYAVRSTGIFCRPGCPSRRPRRDRVTFFLDPAQAQSAGFKACLRCKPLEWKHNQIEIVCRYIEQHLDKNLSLSVLSALVGLSPFHLQRKFKHTLGISPRAYAEACRMKRFKAQLKTESSITQSIYEAGFNSSSRIYERSASQLGMNPSAYRKGGKGKQVTYTTLGSPIGLMLIATTENGVCAVHFADSEAALAEGLKQEFPNAKLNRLDPRLCSHALDVLSFLKGESRSLNLPLDIQATAFQKLVWDHLRSIPAGKTNSYKEVADAIGRPAASRAVARACASNEVAIAIPCHRAVQANGKPGGYRWGLQRKRELLALERDI